MKSYKLILTSLASLWLLGQVPVWAQEDTTVDQVQVESSASQSEADSIESGMSMDESSTTEVTEVSMTLDQLYQKLIDESPMTPEQWNLIPQEKWQTYLDQKGMDFKAVLHLAMTENPDVFSPLALQVKTALVEEQGLSKNLVTGVTDEAVLWAYFHCANDTKALASQLQDGVSYEKASYRGYMSTPYSPSHAEEVVNEAMLTQVHDLFVNSFGYTEATLAKLPQDGMKKVLIDFLTTQPKSADGMGFQDSMVKLYPDVAKENPQAKEVYNQPVAVSLADSQTGEASLMVAAVDPSSTTTFVVETTTSQSTTEASTQAVTTATTTEVAKKNKSFLPNTGEKALPVIGIAAVLLIIGGFIVAKNRKK
ncbi:LPXTG cell wall anchor domain-containing protein [Vaginisenegalia massiliensis]|uniref:LPXTG cell wall anchor domain-containing protein n=1 Tax=Vaginisenegalia massiliensis TaxID=2058294 RepID=UPI000F52552C|nr:LPXTG cell wall anchor domain-containing protein [Vaginisenegalia massiliensis]